MSKSNEEMALPLEQPEQKRPRMSGINTTSTRRSPIVNLNVNGQYFTTTRDTLLQSESSFFSRLLEGAVVKGSLLDDEGRIFIDRDAGVFSQVLDYLRNFDNFTVAGLTQQERTKLHHEAIYYDLEGLIEMTRPPSRGYDERCLSEADKAIRIEAQLARASLSQGNGAEEADKLLIDLFPSQEAEKKVNGLPFQSLFDQPASSPEAFVLFDKQVERARAEHAPDPPESVEEFKTRLIEFGGPLMKDFPMEHVVIAGGAVLKCLHGNANGPLRESQSQSDVDIFLVADTPEHARAAFDRILKHLSRRRDDVAEAIGHQELLVTRSPYAVTFCVGHPQRHIQLILIRRQCIADVILNFDIDCCQVAWDGNRVLATPAAHRALKTGINMADPERASSEYEWRLAKYAMRGFLVAVPGLDVRNVKEHYLRNSCYGYHQGHLKRVHLTFKGGKDGPKYRIEEDNAIEGLRLLLVLSTSFSYGHEERRERGLNRRLQAAEARLPGSPVGPLGMGNYLIDYAKMERSGVGIWKMVTPPNPPPGSLLMSIAQARWVDTAGTNILPLNESPESIFHLLNGSPQENFLYKDGQSSMMDDIHQKRLICFDFLPNVVASTDCPNVEDASRQYRTYPFSGGPGRLKRFLEFPPSTDADSIPWTSGLSADEWTRGVYRE